MGDIQDNAGLMVLRTARVKTDPKWRATISMELKMGLGTKMGFVGWGRCLYGYRNGWC